MNNPLYEYSAIVRRPAASLPEGASVALWFGIAVEHYQFGKPGLSLAPFTAELVPDPLNFAWRDYGPRVGIFRLMKIFADANVPVTGILNSAACHEYPELIEEAVDQGWSWVAHGIDNSTWHVGMDRDKELEVVAGVTETIERATGNRPAGWLGPVLTSTMNTPDVLREAGYHYILDWGNDDQPYWMNVSEGSLASIPYSVELGDIPAFAVGHQSAAAFAESLADAVDQLAADSADGHGPRVLGVGLHSFLVGQPWRALHLARALESLRARKDVWITTSDEIARWWRDAPSPTSTAVG